MHEIHMQALFYNFRIMWLHVIYMQQWTASDAGQQTTELKPGKERSFRRKKRREESKEMQNLQFSLIINNVMSQNDRTYK